MVVYGLSRAPQGGGGGGTTQNQRKPRGGDFAVEDWEKKAQRAKRERDRQAAIAQARAEMAEKRAQRAKEKEAERRQQLADREKAMNEAIAKAKREKQQKEQAELDKQRQIFINRKYKSVGFTDEELEKLKKMNSAELQAEIKKFRQNRYTTSQAPISSLVLRSRYEEQKANNDYDLSPQSTAGLTFEEWRSKYFKSLDQLRNEYYTKNLNITFADYVRQQGDYYTLNPKQTVEVSPSGETTTTTDADTSPDDAEDARITIGKHRSKQKGSELSQEELDAIANMSADELKKAIAQLSKDIEDDRRNKKGGELTQEEIDAIANMSADELRDAIATLGEEIEDAEMLGAESTDDYIAIDSAPRQNKPDTTDPLFQELYQSHKITRDKVLELCRDAEASYDDKLMEDELQYFVRDDFTNTQVLIRLKGDYFTVSFRGTQEATDILTDITSKKANLQVAKLSDFWDWIDTEDDLYAHYGFLQAVRGVYNDLVDKISIYQGKVFDIGSHSLGGALSSIFSYVYKIDPTIDEKVELRFCMTYGSPRVFYNHKIYKVERYDAIVEQIRIFNHNDLVSFVPAQDTEVISSSVMGTMMGGYGLLLGGRRGAMMGGLAGAVAGQFLGGFKHIGLGIMLMGELTHTPYEISTQKILLGGEQVEHHYKIIPKGEDSHRNPFDMVSGSILQNFIGNMMFSFVPNSVKALFISNPEVESVINEKSYTEQMTLMFNDAITGDGAMFEDYKSSLLGEKGTLIDPTDYEQGGTPRMNFIAPTNPQHHLSSKALEYFYRKQIPKFQNWFFNELRRSIFMKGRRDQLRGIEQGTIPAKLFFETSRDDLISATIMENPQFYSVKFLMDKNTDTAKKAIDYDQIKEAINRLHGDKFNTVLANHGRRYYNTLIRSAMKNIDFEDWRNIQYLILGAGMATALANAIHFQSIHQKVIGHKFPSYIDNIQQLPKRIIRKPPLPMDDDKGNTFIPNDDGSFESATQHDEGETIQKYLQTQGIKVDIPEHIEQFRLHADEMGFSFRHNSHKVLGFYFYEEGEDIKNKLVVF